MKQRSDSEIAVAWLANAQTFWALEELSKLCDGEPERAWPVVRRLVELATSEDDLANIGAGPLEDLLAKHGPGLIERIEEAAKTDASFKQCLSHTWQNAMQPDIWARVCLATGREPSNPWGHR
jgi:hypothetical protein